MAFVLQQAVNGGTGLTAAANSFSVSWTTGAGDALFGVVFTSANVSVTPPAGGWTLLGSRIATASVWVSAYYIQGASAQSGAQAWGLGSACIAGGVFMDFTGGAASGLLANGPKTSTGSGITVTSLSLSDTSTNDLILCYGGMKSLSGGQFTFGGTTGGFAIPAGGQCYQGNGSIGVVEGFIAYQILSASGGPYQCSTSVAQPGGIWGAFIASFQAGAAPALASATYPDMTADPNTIVSY